MNALQKNSIHFCPVEYGSITNKTNEEIRFIKKVYIFIHSKLEAYVKHWLKDTSLDTFKVFIFQAYSENVLSVYESKACYDRQKLSESGAFSISELHSSKYDRLFLNLEQLRD